MRKVSFRRILLIAAIILSFWLTGLRSLFFKVAGNSGILLVVVILLVWQWRSNRREKMRLEQEMEDARQAQIRLVPESFPSIEGYDIFGLFKPAREVGGDFFDYVQLSDGKIGIAIADISGKGLKGAMNAVLVNGMLHVVMRDELSCGKILSLINSSLYPRMEKGMFAAFGLAIVDQNSGTIKWAKAGQPHPIVKSGEKTFEFVCEGGLPLGIMPEMEYEDYTLELKTGDIVIFYTDGIMEAESKKKEMYGVERLKQAVSTMNTKMSAEEIIKALLRDISHFVESAEQYDDITIVAVKKL